jgi:hypothetical protein
VFASFASRFGTKLRARRSFPSSQGHKPQARNDATPRGLDPLARPSYHAKQHSGLRVFCWKIAGPFCDVLSFALTHY